VDIHPIKNCTYPDEGNNKHYLPLPYFIPYRALTNKKYENLLVSGRSMSQTFLANAATRVHPVM